MERCGLVIETGGFQVIVDKDLKSGRHRSIWNYSGALLCGRVVNLYREEQGVMPSGKRDLLITPASAAAPWALG